MFIPQADPAPIAPVPSAAQLRWQRSEFGIFVHYGINTYTGREWGDGTEDPKVFNPTRLDTDQWAVEGHTIGNRKLDRLSAPVVATAVKVMIKWTKVPTRISEIALYDSQAGT